ncbi:MAG TPA: helix-turn-helix domain-containing protein [Terriglobales bacterium]|jgi:hypothetical protein|nr:helix-turn-helix domain-containing protein [Terriglobales bacterium]
MSVEAISWVWKHSKSRLAARLLLLRIANNADEDGQNSWHTVPSMAKATNLSDRQVTRACRQLQALGEVEVKFRAGPYEANVYSMPLMGGDKLSPPPPLSATDAPSPAACGDNLSPRVVTNMSSCGDKSVGAIRKERPITSRSKNLITPSGALKQWLSIKERLKTELPQAEWELWVRPARLLKALAGQCLLIALPPSDRIAKAAAARKAQLQALAREAGYKALSFTRYPTEHDLERWKNEYPDSYADLFDALKNRGEEARQHD